MDLTWTTILALTALIGCGIGYAIHNEYRMVQLARRRRIDEFRRQAEHSERLRRIAERLMADQNLTPLDIENER